MTVAKDAAIYPFKLCKAILEGLKEEMKERGRWQASANPVLPAECGEEGDPDQVLGILEKALCSMSHPRESDAYYDATTGQRLKPELVKVARGVEMEYFQDKNVYTKRPRAEAFARMGKASITVKW